MKFLRAIGLILFFSSFVSGQRAECFPFEKLPLEKRKKAEELLLKALDSESLYTIIGGLKPMSSGFVSFTFSVAQIRNISEVEARQMLKNFQDERTRQNATDEQKNQLRRAENFLKRLETLREIDETREILRYFRCGDNFFADVQHFAKTYEGTRFNEAVIFNLPRLAAKIAEKSAFFGRWGIDKNSHPLQVLYAIEYDETVARFAGYGYLFGYPDYAVNFFVQAAAEEQATGIFVERDFISLPTFVSPTNRFVYAVPKGHQENEADQSLREKATAIFAEYQQKRRKFIGEGKKGVVELARHWLCDEQKKC